MRFAIYSSSGAAKTKHLSYGGGSVGPKGVAPGGIRVVMGGYLGGGEGFLAEGARALIR